VNQPTPEQCARFLRASNYSAARRIARNLETAMRARTSRAASAAADRIDRNITRIEPAAVETIDRAMWAIEYARDASIMLAIASIYQRSSPDET